MANEGDFPKIDGDILYASEANKFNPKFLDYVAPVGTTYESGTNFFTIGSALYPGAGSQQIHSFLHISTGGEMRNSVDQRIIISGAGMNNIVLVTMENASSNPSVIPLNYILTSGIMTTSGGNIGSQYYLYYQILTNNTYAGPPWLGILMWGH